jgi:hypothetical protein
MAKITGGLFSMGASGQIGKAIVFGSWKGRKYVRTHVVPKNPRTTAQSHVRGTFTWLHEVYKQSPQLFRDPWELLAKSFAMTSWNKFTQKNQSPLIGQANLANFVFEEGAGGGLPPSSVVVTHAATSLTITTVNPTPPTGWLLDSMVGAVIRDEAPTGDVIEPMFAAEDTTTKDTVTINGLTTGQLYRCGAWLKYTKPDGKFAYSVSLQASGTPS